MNIKLLDLCLKTSYNNISNCLSFDNRRTILKLESGLLAQMKEK